ncbi:hypothetical protein BDZ91DRAFT_729816 [Kalaharituber pfeilii]|nr:hypothetical protein BDZ91DRAFT_729816 [Kalaharituber pfeilii]
MRLGKPSIMAPLWPLLWGEGFASTQNAGEKVCGKILDIFSVMRLGQVPVDETGKEDIEFPFTSRRASESRYPLGDL